MAQKPKISLIASSIRTNLYPEFFKSLENESVDYEVVFAGDCTKHNMPMYKGLKYIETGDIKPAQCYEIARRNATGDYICWVADDCEFIGGILTSAVKYMEEINNPKTILSLQTKEADAFIGRMHLCPMKLHSFFGGNPRTPLMAPLGLMNRSCLDLMGGFDKNFVCGQYENDVVMRLISLGGNVEVFGGDKQHIEIDHHKKHGGPRAFHNYYPTDRKVLESAWVINKEISPKRLTTFEAYNSKDILTISQSNKGHWS